MLTKQHLIIKIACVLFAIVPFIAMYGEGYFFMPFVLGFLGIYLILNIFAHLTIGDFKQTRNILNAFDGLIILLSFIIYIYFGIIAMDKESNFHIIFFPALTKSFFLGILGLFLNNLKIQQSKIIKKDREKQKEIYHNTWFLFAKPRLILKIACALCTIMPYVIFFGRISFFLSIILLGSLGLYILINLFAFSTRKESELMKDISNAIDALIVLLTLVIFVYLFIVAIDGGEAGFLILFFPILGEFLFLGILGLYFNNSKTPQHGDI